ncbi:MAG TPA: TlyA family RNA methyltransferase [Pseudonocardiaceae bacterium]|nr:TlyA family RNA methyltransferase [Pseudonocardiaceae bacterium]
MGGRKARLDAELVRRGLARSRDHAAELVAQGRVRVGGLTAAKPATGVDPDTPLRVRGQEDEPQWVSRGARKLLGALDRLITGGPVIAGRRCLDAGASTGGFTEVLLRRQAREVVAVDVGYGQLAWSLRTDQRVRVLDRTNARTLEPDEIGGPVDLTVADLSFISLRLVLPALAGCTASGGDLLPMVKPQFEVGRERLGRGGVVRDPELREQAMLDVLAVTADLGLSLVDAVASPLRGPAGNVEYFLWLTRSPAFPVGPAPELVHSAVARGPQ